MFSLFVQAAWRVLEYGLLLGAGLPILYALGVRSLAIASVNADAEGDVGSDARRSPVGVLLAVLCLFVVVTGVVIGLTYIVAAGQGKMLSFDHGYPTIVQKS